MSDFRATSSGTHNSVSVVIPFYNRSRFADRLFRSIVGQTLKPADVYIVDNGSAPEELAACRSIAASLDWCGIQPHFLKTETKGNANVARNLGMEVSCNRYVAFLDSDDWWDSQHLARSLDRLRSTGKAGVYAGARIHNDGIQVNRSRDVNTCANPFDLLFSYDSAQTSSYVVDLEALGGNVHWNEDLRRHQDYDFFLRIYFETHGWAFLDTPFTHIDWDQGGARKSIDFRSMIRFKQKWAHKIPAEPLRRYAYSQILKCREVGAHRRYLNYYRLLHLAASGKRLSAQMCCFDWYLDLMAFLHRLAARIQVSGRACPKT